MDPENTLEQFLEKLLNKIPNIKNMEHQMPESNNQNTDIDIDILAALNMTSKKDTSCSHHTSHTMLNPNPSYQFANNPGVDACSHPVRLELVPANTLLACQAPGIQPLCSLYSPDYKIVKKFVSTEDDTHFYYLTKYRSLNGSYVYKIYDSLMNLYQTLSYDNLSNKDYDIDSYAYDVFENFVQDSMIQLTEVYSEESLVDHSNSNKKSYLATLVS